MSPFDQGGHRAPAAQGMGMHAPHGLADAAAVVVNHDVARMHMAREVDFGHGHVAAQGIQPGAAAARPASVSAAVAAGGMACGPAPGAGRLAWPGSPGRRVRRGH